MAGVSVGWPQMTCRCVWGLVLQGGWIGIARYWWPHSEGYWGLGGMLRTGVKVEEAGVRDDLEIISSLRLP